MKCKVIGIGAAGNKAAINLIEKGVISEQNVKLINSTLRDIPEGYRQLAVKLSDDIRGGCGKERNLAKDLSIKGIQSGSLELDSIMDPDDDLVIIVNSSEGGTGCGASSIIAKYMKQVVGVNVHCFVFTGFEEDSRGLQNTIEYFQDLEEGFTVEAISNKKFLDGNKNKLKAEKAANDEFANRVQILLGQMIVDSEQNIDETDLYKVSTTPGFMSIEHANLEKIKNVDNFNKVVTEMIDNSYSLDITDSSAKRLAVILNISEKTRDYIDYGFEVIKDKFGTPFEVFTHVQYEGEDEYICLIASGMHMPIDDVKQIYENYKLESEKVNKNKDSFFSFASNMKSKEEDSMFNMMDEKESTTSSKEDFLNQFDVKEEKPKKKKTEVKVSKEEFLKNNY